MNFATCLRKTRLGCSPWAALALTTLVAIAITVYSLLSGWVIIFQNLLYIPMVIACMYYARKGFLFSTALSLLYLFLIMALIGDLAAILQALMRVFIFVGVAGVITFLSIKRRQVEEQLRQHRTNLERLVEERTAALAQMAEETGRRREELLHVSRLSTLGEMASGIAHELNQPLAAIGNYGDACLCLLQAGAPDVARLTRNLHQIVSQSERAGAIIRKMRALVKKQPLQLAPVNLNEAIQSILLLVRSELADQAVQLKLELTEPLPSVLADAVQMEQVVLNLVRNALEAMDGTEESPRLLTIRTQRREPDLVRMEVCDTGVGLPPEEPPRIFEPFFTTKANGLGLGLPISRSIVQLHHGALAARRNPGRGSTFSVMLPAARAQGPAPARPVPRPLEAEEPQERNSWQPPLREQDTVSHTTIRWQGVVDDVTY